MASEMMRYYKDEEKNKKRLIIILSTNRRARKEEARLGQCGSISYADVRILFLTGLISRSQSNASISISGEGVDLSPRRGDMDINVTRCVPSSSSRARFMPGTGLLPIPNIILSGCSSCTRTSRSKGKEESIRSERNGSSSIELKLVSISTLLLRVRVPVPRGDGRFIE